MYKRLQNELLHISLSVRFIFGHYTVPSCQSFHCHIPTIDKISIVKFYMNNNIKIMIAFILYSR